ncbi:type II toxin-antitoxin system Phd/YefM family antitoxin [Pontibacter sp. G13]|uniref:type II toxin-antitoxin system Phd/YefM family antitoxin n=1 Tax=Pontibacter sp. G13 TaxID=3074898 RepID=UPI00288B9330|nr:type II toxin-antitoxin system Phd/YefM family antitoxin [Pontibacter sp. G13]WNJ18744.1 type II toxin-antitoxin system Phd/YefM family antitoxin [Pontibacter sp. G13]
MLDLHDPSLKIFKGRCGVSTSAFFCGLVLIGTMAILSTNKVRMFSVSISEFRSNLKSYFDRIIENEEVLVIPRGKDDGVVIMPLSEYNAMKTTEYLLSAKANEVWLDESIAQYKSGKTITIDELGE